MEVEQQQSQMRPTESADPRDANSDPARQMGTEVVFADAADGVKASLADRYPGWRHTPPTPWRRYGGRILDVAVSGVAGFFLLGIAAYAIAPATADRMFAVFETPAGVVFDLIATVLMAALINGILLGMTGFTLGKLIFGIRVVTLEGESPGIAAAWRREFAASLKGLALGVPVLSLITMWMAKTRLEKHGESAWDKGRHILLHRQPGTLQTTLNVAGIAMIFAMRALIKSL